MRDYLRRKSLETLQLYWMLVKLIVPVTLAVEILSRLGVVAALAPALTPLMGIFGLPPEAALPVLTGLMGGIWPAFTTLFLLVPLEGLTAAQITTFSSLLLFAHALPVEQTIIRRAGPGFWITLLLRLAGGTIFAILVYRITLATGWLSGPVNLAYLPVAPGGGWPGFAKGLAQTLLLMLVMLFILAFAMDGLKRSGIMDALMRALMPVLRFAGLREEAAQLTAIGLFLGISYGGGLLIREAQSGAVSPRQVFLACAFMGFAHSVIEDTALVVALGASALAVLPGRIVFALVATRLLAATLRRIDEANPPRWLHPAAKPPQA